MFIHTAYAQKWRRPRFTCRLGTANSCLSNAPSVVLLFCIGLALPGCASHASQRASANSEIKGPTTAAASQKDGPASPDSKDVLSNPAAKEYLLRVMLERYPQARQISNPAVLELLLRQMMKERAEQLSNRQDIELANTDATDIDIRDLPVRDYPLLRKFTHVRQISLASLKPVATDAHLEALASLGFTELKCVVLQNCRMITDRGIRALSKIESLKQLGLEGTSITDEACEVLAHSMTDVNIANCRNVTLRGIKALASSETLEELRFSADDLAQEQVFDVLDSFRKVTWCEIVDLHGKLDANAIEATGAKRNIQVHVRRTGALQDTFQVGG